MPRYRVPDTVLSQRIGDELVLLNLADGTYHGLDAVGTRMFGLLQQHGEIEAAVADLVTEFVVDEAQVRRDLQTLADELQASGLLHKL